MAPSFDDSVTTWAGVAVLDQEYISVKVHSEICYIYLDFFFFWQVFKKIFRDVKTSEKFISKIKRSVPGLKRSFDQA